MPISPRTCSRSARAGDAQLRREKGCRVLVAAQSTQGDQVTSLEDLEFVDDRTLFEVISQTDTQALANLLGLGELGCACFSGHRHSLRNWDRDTPIPRWPRIGGNR